MAVINFAADHTDNKTFGATTGNVERWARKFTATVNAVSANLTLGLYKVGSPTDDAVIAIQADSAGAPSGTDLGSLSIAGSSITDTSFPTPYALGNITVSLTSGTAYWVVLRRSGTLNDANRYAFGSGTGTGVVDDYISGVWNAVAIDFTGSLELTEPSSSGFFAFM